MIRLNSNVSNAKSTNTGANSPVNPRLQRIPSLIDPTPRASNSIYKGSFEPSNKSIILGSTKSPGKTPAVNVQKRSQIKIEQDSRTESDIEEIDEQESLNKGRNKSYTSLAKDMKSISNNNNNPRDSTDGNDEVTISERGDTKDLSDGNKSGRIPTVRENSRKTPPLPNINLARKPSNSKSARVEVKSSEEENDIGSLII